MTYYVNKYVGWPSYATLYGAGYGEWPNFTREYDAGYYFDLVLT